MSCRSVNLTSSVSQGNIPQFLTNRGRIGSDSMPPTTVEISTSKGYTGKEHSVIQFPGATKVPIGTKVQFRQGTINSCGGKEESMTRVKTPLLCQPQSSCFSVSNPTEAYFEYCLANAYRQYAARETKQPSVISFRKQFNLIKHIALLQTQRHFDASLYRSNIVRTSSREAWILSTRQKNTMWISVYARCYCVSLYFRQ